MCTDSAISTVTAASAQQALGEFSMTCSSTVALLTAKLVAQIVNFLQAPNPFKLRPRPVQEATSSYSALPESTVGVSPSQGNSQSAELAHPLLHGCPQQNPMAAVQDPLMLLAAAVIQVCKGVSCFGYGHDSHRILVQSSSQCVWHIACAATQLNLSYRAVL